ncbi:helix-turn-helix transcriptional regulator [Actinoplanes sichuanensis]|uniref:YafY family protein n=1 Tax=Actinoplanes sichuanensis TaxID=512349 RepID=A0ABW4AUN1_9ACTN|nr:YafY family protein [Actinoplanes sichuanensis]
MTRPTARVLALLEILQTGGTHRVDDLAGRLGVDERTVRRYAGHLVDLEVPVESIRGRHGGYRLAPGFRLPPLMFTDDEALAVLLGLEAGPVAMPGGAAEAAAAKIRRVLPRTLAARLAALFASTEFTAAVRPQPAPETAVLLRLAEATRARHPTVIGYTDRSGRSTERTLHPYGIVAHSGRWYVTGWDSVSGESRTFRLDRIRWIRRLDGTFPVPDGFRPADAVLTGLAGTPWRYEVEVAVQGSVEEVRPLLPAGLATVDDDETAGWALVRLRAERLDWLPPVLAGLARPFVIRRPAELREIVRAWADRVAGYASEGGPPCRGSDPPGRVDA